jgi:hypothetical protein
MVIAQSNASHIIKMIRLLGNKILIIGRILGSTIKRAIQHKLTKKIFISVGVIATVAITVKILRPHLIPVRDRFVKKKLNWYNKGIHIYIYILFKKIISIFTFIKTNNWYAWDLNPELFG